MNRSHLALYCDEDVSVRVAVNLRNRGFDVQTTVEAGNLGIDDERQLAYAASQKRVFLTHNLKDFIALHKTWLSADRCHAGIILAVRRKDPNSFVIRLLEFIQNTTPQEMENQLRYV